MEATPPPPPIIMDQNGRLRDPYTGNALEDGQDGPGSIFHVPLSRNDREFIYSTGKDTSMSHSQKMESLRASGFEGEYIMLYITPRPEDLDSIPPPPPPKGNFIGDLAVETVLGDLYRTECNYCWAIACEREREKGFTLHEINQAAANGCGTCTILHTGITRFADLIFPEYEGRRVRVRQKEHGKSNLLSETRAVHVSFDEYDGETMILSFNGSVDRSKRMVTWDSRVMETSSWDGRIMETCSYEATLLIKDWLRECSNKHPECGIPPVSPLPMRILEISNAKVKLVEKKGMVGPYITLSHCWGLKPIIRLLKSNIEDFKRDIPWTLLSKTFQDTITIAWKLEFRYVWIDALCILQDSVDDWEFHASKMALIFSNSQLTISASSGADGSKGCFSSRSKEPYILHSLDSRKIWNPLLWVPFLLEGNDRDNCKKTFTIRLKAPHGLYQNRRPKEPLLKRAWVFQEQILSSRIVHFASGELYFECKSHVACECSGWTRRSNCYQWETRWRKAHTKLVGQGGQISPGSSQVELAHRRGEFEAYRALIETYTELDITEELDRLPALSGVTFGRKDEYLAGIWRSHLLESLHWYPRAKSLGNIMARRPFKYRAPTWSWVSMESPIKYLEDDFYRARPHSKLVASIIDASATPAGLDPRGRVTGGYLRIQGPMGEARVTAVGICEREGSTQEEFRKKIAKIDPSAIDPAIVTQTLYQDLCAFATVERNGVQGCCYLDVPLALCCTRPAEVDIGEELLLLIVSSQTIMVLKAVPDAPGSYTRVGIFRPKTEGWEFDNSRKSIFIR